jgi:hypothetical protein
MESLKWEYWNNIFCCTVSFLTGPHCVDIIGWTMSSSFNNMQGTRQSPCIERVFLIDNSVRSVQLCHQNRGTGKLMLLLSINDWLLLNVKCVVTFIHVLNKLQTMNLILSMQKSREREIQLSIAYLYSQLMPRISLTLLDTTNTDTNRFSGTYFFNIVFHAP